MENKKTFGAYICRRRKELGLTQREFADRLFVTESAVSKWERGMSYPDITLIRDICAILQVSEHELLTASEDVEARTAETLAKKYLSLLRRLRWIQYILYGGTALICLICNLAVGHTLDWFWLVLTGELVGASLTLLPILVKQYRGVITLGGFTLSLELLLLAACLKNGCRVTLDTDAHSTTQLQGNMPPLLAMLEEMQFPQELVVNATRQNLVNELKLHGRICAEYIGGEIL